MTKNSSQGGGGVLLISGPIYLCHLCLPAQLSSELLFVDNRHKAVTIGFFYTDMFRTLTLQVR